MIVLLGVITSINADAHYGGVSRAKFAQPVIDGTLEGGEWPTESKLEGETITYPDNYKTSVTIYSAYDKENLYIAFVFGPTKEYTINPDLFHIDGLFIDLDHDGTMNDKRDLVIKDYRWMGVLQPSASVDIYGTTDKRRELIRNYGWNGDSVIYEIKIPMEMWGVKQFSTQSTVSLGVLFGAAGSSNGLQFFAFPSNSMSWKWEYSNGLAYNIITRPDFFADVLLSDSQDSIGSKSIPLENKGTSSQVPVGEATRSTVAEQGQETLSGLAFVGGESTVIAIGIAVAGIAIAAAIVASRRRNVSSSVTPPS